MSYAETAETLERLPELVYDRRTRCGLTIREAAAQIGISHPCLYRMERGLHCQAWSALLALRWLATEERG